MSSPSAIATVTSALSLLLTNVLGSASVTTKPPGVARNGNNGNQLNIYLYSTSIDTAFSNSPMPDQIKRGESGMPPLALVLKYLITAYGSEDDDISAHHLMGHSMSTLHDHPILGRSDIEGIVPDSDLHNQIERVRITHDVLSVDDMSKLWTSFQSEYRLSSGYEVSVVLIESMRPAKTPLPVLKRGITVQPDLIPPFPAISEIELPKQQTSALLGDTLIVKGHHLDGDTVSVRFIHPDFTDPIIVPAPGGGTENQISVQIPNNTVDWPIGFYTIELVIVKAGEQDRITNILPFILSPKIDRSASPNPVLLDGSGNATLTLRCKPQLRTGQLAVLLFGDREVTTENISQIDETDINQFTTLVFLIEDAPIGSRHIRLRVDGVDSLLVDRSVSPPAFDSAMEVTIT